MTCNVSAKHELESFWQDPTNNKTVPKSLSKIFEPFEYEGTNQILEQDIHEDKSECSEERTELEQQLSQLLQRPSNRSKKSQNPQS